MNRAPNTNGHPAESVRARGGYDAYFSPQPAGADAAAAEAAPSEKQSDAFRYVSGLPTQAAAPPTVGAPGQSQPAQAQPQPAQAQSGHTQAAPPQTTQPQAAQTQSGQTQAAQPPSAPSQPAQSQPAQSYSTPEQHTQTQAAQPQWSADPVAPPPAATPSQPTSSQSRGLERVDRSYSDVSRPEVLPASLTSMDLLAEISASRRAQLRSTTGMRGALNKVGFNIGLSPAEQRTEDRRARIRRQLTSTYQIAVVSVKGGVGRTTITAALGSTFARLRPDRVIAVDGNPDFGDLPGRTSPHPYGLTLRDLVRAQNLEAFSAVHSFTSINEADLSVLASPWSTEAVEALSGQEYGNAISVLRKHYNLVMVDCGTGVLDSVTGAVLQTSDAVVVVTPPTVGGVKGAVATLNWFAAHGLQHLIATSVVAIVHQHAAKPMVEVEQIEKLFATAQRPTFQLPYDEHLAEGGEIDLRLLDKDTVLAFEEVAATLGDGFGNQPTADRGGRR
ncbi:MinD-like ATPase involved in chromosome partitioning or flagellar assembly [Nocardia transvalensis]|uniref:MinD-like ATPase involved in chromosome partitioning or flagellar assembly n=1 Tax=Nocardia transvalensis TaxID=37333 RepID=A0A7W9PM77_9NOCA|nr:MinD/ParA family protein [Nocardia transvalensis]MBB5918746.1 MinD-like ATPase involved in chromosome partitioning or flagellar assembly [Nocardia transvalensis]